MLHVFHHETCQNCILTSFESHKKVEVVLHHFSFQTSFFSWEAGAAQIRQLPRSISFNLRQTPYNCQKSGCPNFCCQRTILQASLPKVSGIATKYSQRKSAPGVSINNFIWFNVLTQAYRAIPPLFLLSSYTAIVVLIQL